MKNFYYLFLLFASNILYAQPSCSWAYMPVGAAQTYNDIYYAAHDASGNIIELGKTLGRADMNPAPADTVLTPNGSYNFYLSKTSNSGNLLWIKYFGYNGITSFFEFKGLKVAANDDIVVVGNYFGLIDFDLSAAGMDTLRSHEPTYPDFFIARYSTNGDYQWAKSLGDAGTPDIKAMAMTIMPNNNIVVAVNPSGSGAVDIDPSAAVHGTIGSTANLVCYNPQGQYVWNARVATPYAAAVPNNTVACDNWTNTYVMSVGYYKLTVSKFTITGANIWENTIGDFPAGARVNPQSILVEKATGNFYVAGTFGGTVDFDPTAAVVNRTNSSPSYQDGFIAKYDTDMNLLWVNAYAGKIEFGTHGLEFDNGDLVAVGNFAGSVDVGNGAVLTTASNLSPFYIKMNTAGVVQSNFTLNGSGRFLTVHKNTPNTTLITGYLGSTTDMDPSAANLTLNTTVNKAFTAVYQTQTVIATENPKNTGNITVFPNPAHESFNVNVSDNLIDADYNLYNSVGILVLNGKINEKQTVIRLKSQTAGVYFLKIGNAVFRIIVV